MSQQPANVATLFADLHKFGQNQDYEKALKTANKILQELPDDVTAFHCKIVCLVHLGEFEDALKKITSSKHQGELVFEKAYCQYRLNKTSDALVTLREIEDPDVRVQELMAQVLYRLENYEECYSLYKNLVKNSEDDFEQERYTNFSAVMAALQISGTQDVEDLGLEEDSYELLYNSACLHLAKGLYKKAEDKLRKAEEMCRQTFSEDADATEEELEDELAIIRVQLGFALQMQGRTEEALKLYNLVVKQKPSDAALTAVASNNVVSLNKDQNVFDSKKKMKTATSEGVQQKLTSAQKQAIQLNQCLLLMYTNQGEQCRKSAKALQAMHPESDKPSLIIAAQCVKDKQIPKAVEALQEHVSSHPEQSVSIKLTLAQLNLLQGMVYPACENLRALGEHSFRPGVVSALVSLYLKEEDRASASEVLNQAVDWWKKNNPNSEETATLMTSNANFQLRYGSAEMAAKLLEELRKQKPKDSKILAQLISAYSKFNPAKAQELSKSLPSASEIAQELDVEALEKSINVMGPKYIKKSTKVESPRPGTDDELLQKKRKKKHKKGKLPKNYDPGSDPDPERWLPKKERSYYRGKRKDKRKEIGRGAQGATSGGADLDASKPSGESSASPAAGSAPSPVAPGPRQQKPQSGNKQKKKKKGSKW
ncbi:signal recognition particle subunit SRP72 [Lingula anatina]|uniref:Signal recognition particle subunit SRP72 n=1 Tax=Lingula anatina TaxID=7574 RepID=A0A1S3K477_LINAN|nr:signal recognition particle subunit SRP72 [Lingula anatina]|eukprot:XP_013417430.1 signal recognition particle subunit SRP72 [Lingula anatina]